MLFVTDKFSRSLITALFFCSLFYGGCRKKDNNGLPARTGAEWVKSAVVYKIYLRSFSKEGTFKSLEAKIPELKELGVTVISLMPVHPVGELNRQGKFGNPYAVKDLYAVNPEFGEMSDFKSLVQTIHQCGLKIVIELVAGQAAWDSKILIEHPDWFIHNDEGAIVSPSPDLFDVAQIDYYQHEPRKYMIAMMKYWVDEAGIDGFECYKPETIPMDFWEVSRGEMDKSKPTVLISEDGLPEYHINAFDLTYSWNVSGAVRNAIDGISPAGVINDSLTNELLKFPNGSLRLMFNTTYFNNDESDRTYNDITTQSAKASAVIVFTIPGVPIIFSGEEVGNNEEPDLCDKTDIDWSDKLDYRKLYKKLCEVRRNHPALTGGSYFYMPNNEKESVYSFLRTSGADSVLAIINVAKYKKDINLDLSSGRTVDWMDEFSGTGYRTVNSNIKIILPPFGYAVLVPVTGKGSK